MEYLDINKYWSLIDEKLNVWLETIIKHIPNLVVAICFIIIFSVVARIVGKLVKQFLRRSLDSQQIADLLAAIFKVCFILTGVFICLDFIGLKGTVTSLLAGAGIIGLAIGFAFQDMTENLIAGVAMGIRKPFSIGDIIEADNVFGKVITINLRNTIVETFSSQIEVIPNKILFRNIVTNYSSLSIRRVEVPVSISYADDPDHAKEVIVDAINQCDFVIKQDQTDVYAESFGDSAVNLLVWFWIDYPGETGYMSARHQAISLIKKSLEQADILIPFPIRTLEFGAKGGETLGDILTQQAQVKNSKAEKE
ncbi:mechanosensitive ion channel family protein [Thalassotalea piscium]|uniref:Small-conductance mechanosensitive channel n=1 Tax=Thalassotalea piscium TaxID=1230533 RepID=A0A7X0TUM4_9GAMM|nr:mechanosensitive ion channel family protein [Thalassotalea piscium]MBB6544363.1 small-conductance mechanosensitive channel [Thalassotalea piscium]